MVNSRKDLPLVKLTTDLNFFTLWFANVSKHLSDHTPELYEIQVNFSKKKKWNIEKTNLFDYLKFVFSEKATKFEKIFVVLLTRVSCSAHVTAYFSKSWRRFLKINVVKSYYTNFNYRLLFLDPLPKGFSPI